MTYTTSECKYIKESEKGTSVEEFVDSLYRSRIKPNTIRQHLYAVRKCSELVGKDIHYVTSDDFDNLRISLSKEVSERTADTYLTRFNRYCKYVTGQPIIQERRQTCFRRTREETDEIRIFREKQSSIGMSAVTIKNHVNDVNHCLKMLSANGDSTDPKDITSLTIYQLGEKITADRQRKLQYLRSLGLYVLANTGTNPYQDYIKKNWQKKGSTIRVSAYEKELKKFEECRWDYDISDKQFDRHVRQARLMLIRIVKKFGYIPVDEITNRHLIQLRRQMDDEPEEEQLCDNSLSRYMTSLGIFLAAVRKDKRNIVAEIGFNWNKVVTHRKVMTDEDFHKLFNAADDQERVMLLLGANRGLRRGEIGTINVKSFNENSYTVKGKGCGPMGTPAIQKIDELRPSLDAQLDARDEVFEKYGDGSDGALFVNKYGRPLGPDGVEHRLRKLGKKAKVNYSPHSLRSYYARTMRRCKTDPSVITSNMRHASFGTTLTCYLYDDPELMDYANKMVYDHIMSDQIQNVDQQATNDANQKVYQYLMNMANQVKDEQIVKNPYQKTYLPPASNVS